MPRKSALADRYLAAIQSPCDGESNGQGPVSEEAGNCEVKIEYTYRPPTATNDDDDDDDDYNNNNTTGVGGASADDDSPKLVTASTEEETTTDEEDDHPGEHVDEVFRAAAEKNNNSLRQQLEFASIPLRRVGPNESRRSLPLPIRSVASDVLSEASEPVNAQQQQQQQQQQQPEFASIPLRRVGGTGTTRRSIGRDGLPVPIRSVASDVLSEASEPVKILKKPNGAATATGAGPASSADNGCQGQSQDKLNGGVEVVVGDDDTTNDDYSFKPIPKVATSPDTPNNKMPGTSAPGPAGVSTSGGGGKVKMWASKFNKCHVDTTSSTVGTSPFVCAPPTVGVAARKSSVVATGTSKKDVDDLPPTSNQPPFPNDDAEDVAAALHKTAIMVRGSVSPGRRSASMSDRERQILKGHQKQKEQAQSPLREKEIWRRRRKEREREAKQLRQIEKVCATGTATGKSGPGSVVSVPVSALSTPPTEVHTNRTSDFRRNLWLDRSSVRVVAGGATGANGDGEEDNVDVANPQEEETDSESDNPDLAADAEVRRLSRSESERAAALVTSGKGGKTSSFAPDGGRVTPLTTEVGAEKDDGAGKGGNNIGTGSSARAASGELNSALGTKPPRTPKVSIKPGGLVAARQRAFSGGAAPAKTKSPPHKYRAKKSLADDISHADSSVVTPAVAMTDDIIEAEVDDVAEPLPPAFSPLIKADVSLTSSTDVELGVIGEEPPDGSDDEDEDPLTGMSFKLNLSSRNTGKKKKNAKKNVTSEISNAEASSSSAVSSSKPIWTQVKLRKTSRGSALQPTSTSGDTLAQDTPPPTEDEGAVDPQPSTSLTSSTSSSFPVQALRPTPAPNDTSTPQSPNAASSSVDWAPAQLSPGPFSAGKEAPAFQDGPSAPLLVGQEYASRRVTSSVQKKHVMQTHTTAAFGSADRIDAKPSPSSSHPRPRRVDSFMSTESEGVQNLRHKFEANEDPSEEAVDHENASLIRIKFEEMASPPPSGREAVTNTRQVFEKKTVRDRAPQPVPLIDTSIFQPYDADVDGQVNEEETGHFSSTPRGVQDVKSTFEPEPKRFSPEKQAMRRPPQSHQPVMRHSIDVATNGGCGDDEHRSQVENWMAEVKKIRSRFDARPDPPIRSARRTTGTSLSNVDVDSRESGDNSQQTTPRWLDIDTDKIAAVNESPFKSFDAQAQKASAVMQARTPPRHSSVRRDHSAAASMASKASWPSTYAGRFSSASSAIDFEDAVTLSPQSTVVSELTPSSRPSRAMPDNHSEDNRYVASAPAPARTSNSSVPSASATTPTGVKIRAAKSKTRDISKRAAASGVIPRSPDPPGKIEAVSRMADPPESEERIHVSISPIPFRSSPNNVIPPFPKAGTHTSLKKEDAKEDADAEAWATFDAFENDPFASSFAVDFNAAFNAFQSEGTPSAPTRTSASAPTRANHVDPKLVDIMSPPRVTKSFDSSERSIDDAVSAVSASTANTPLRSNRKGDSSSNYEVSEELGLPARPTHILANESTSAVSKRLDELREARRARQSELSHTKSDADPSSKSMAKPLAAPNTPPRGGITGRLSRLGSYSPMIGLGSQEGAAAIPLTQQEEDRYSPLLVEGVDIMQRSKKKNGSKTRGLSRFGSKKSTPLLGRWRS